MMHRPKAGDRAWYVDREGNRIRLVVVEEPSVLGKPVRVRTVGDHLAEVRKSELFRSYQAAMIQSYVNHYNAGCVR